MRLEWLLSSGCHLINPRSRPHKLAQLFYQVSTTVVGDKDRSGSQHYSQVETQTSHAKQKAAETGGFIAVVCARCTLELRDEFVHHLPSTLASKDPCQTDHTSGIMCLTRLSGTLWRLNIVRHATASDVRKMRGRPIRETYHVFPGQ